ncbi:stage III sporulation protein AF [Paenibacillus sp. S150]|uniref:stage III sporulation protein AF n=1 Tax=Paenibacillus sp. S150 TaxID=2749826 RepID=UPI001C56F6EE|nr:stage III sporulation protein AF [Paenibacillus sp. S150]MBW4081813.1 stage III sporulation protein AF [Paenibacillus sp. S150]
MTWLGEWLRELILVVLMAAFVEMLLPSKSMERYARLVLSLLVLLTMLSPIVSMLKGDAAGELSLAMDQQEKEGGLLSGAGEGAGSLEKILADGRMLAAGAQEQSLKLAAEEVAGQMRDQIAGSTGVQGAKVTVTLGMGKAAGSLGGEAVPVISSVSVALPAAAPAGGTEGKAAEGTAAGPAPEPIVITPVEPVQVSLGSGEGEAAPEAPATSSAEAPDGSSAAAGGGTAEAEAESIIRLLEQNWNLSREVIEVQSSGAGAAKL